MPARTALQHVPFPFPKWWHPHGYKIAVTDLDLPHRTLTFDAPAAHGRISRVGKDRWDFEWHVVHTQHTHETRGHFVTDSRSLRTMFGLPDGSPGDAEFTRRYGADAMLPGSYIRKGAFLNVPGPGIGYDGDPNISIHVDDKIRAAVEKLLTSA